MCLRFYSCIKHGQEQALCQIADQRPGGFQRTCRLMVADAFVKLSGAFDLKRLFFFAHIRMKSY